MPKGSLGGAVNLCDLAANSVLANQLGDRQEEVGVKTKTVIEPIENFQLLGSMVAAIPDIFSDERPILLFHKAVVVLA